ncbi:unnamed protein product, partial [Amaranthus hypochondriacus]
MNHISNTFVDDPIDNDINIDHNVRINENSNVVDDIEHVNVVNDDIDEDIEHVFDANIDDDAFVNDNTDYNVDIFDPRNWDGLDSQMIDILVVKGPKRDLSIIKGAKDKMGRQFSSSFYTRVLPNGEKIDRDWLVYSKELDCVFCFCCKLFKKGVGRGQLANGGFSDWAHLCVRIREHEIGMEHLQNMTTWYDLRLRLQRNTTIDKVAQQQLEKGKEHWKNILLRIIAIVKFLEKHNLAFRGTNEKLYQNSNGNFLGLIEMLDAFDPIVQDHVRRITNNETHVHYLGHNIQNELILLLARAIKNEIV